jgi:hypothetical protein
MVESQLAHEWTADARREGVFTGKREFLLGALRRRFPGPVPQEVVELINQQDSAELLQDWFFAALDASSLEEFLAVLRR